MTLSKVEQPFPASSLVEVLNRRAGVQLGTQLEESILRSTGDQCLAKVSMDLTVKVIRGQFS